MLSSHVDSLLDGLFLMKIIRWNRCWRTLFLFFEEKHETRLRPPFWFYNPPLSTRKIISFVVLLLFSIHFCWLLHLSPSRVKWNFSNLTYKRNTLNNFHHPNILTIAWDREKEQGSLYEIVKSAGRNTLLSLAILLDLIVFRIVSLSLSWKDKLGFLAFSSQLIIFGLLISNQHYYIS